MLSRRNWITGLVALGLLLGFGCTDPGLVNFFAPMGGGVAVVFVNETPYKVSTFWGVYNPLDPTNGTDIRPIELEGGQQSGQVIQIATRRSFDVGGSALRRAAELASLPDIDPEAITDRIAFTDEEGNIVGTAPAGRFGVGVDYNANDFIEIHFQQIPDTNNFTVIMFAEP